MCPTVVAAAVVLSAISSTEATGNLRGILLLIDKSVVESTRGVTFSLNPPKKHAASPVLLPGDTSRWDSLQVSWPATVLYSSVDKVFRCWYAGLDAVQSTGRFWKTGYAESNDGIHWTKPDLGQETYLDRPTNRIVLPWVAGNGFLRCVFENRDRGNPGRRFGAMYLDSVPGVHTLYGICWSADGKVWQKGDAVYDYGRFRQDVCQVLYDELAPDADFRILAYSQLQCGRDWDGRQGIRQIGLAHGPGVEALTPFKEPLILKPQKGIDEELHGCSVYPVGGNYIMLFESDRLSSIPLHGDLRLAVSSDGRSFRRVYPNQPYIPTGPRGSWDENLIINTAASIQEVGDELFIYYIGCPGVYNNWPGTYAVSNDRRGSLFYPTSMGLAVLPRDRFAYASGPGEIITHPLQVGQPGVWINADGDGIAVEALSTEGASVAAGRPDAKRWRTVYRGIAWDGPLPEGRLRLRFTLDASAKLYSVRY